MKYPEKIGVNATQYFNAMMSLENLEGLWYQKTKLLITTDVIFENWILDTFGYLKYEKKVSFWALTTGVYWDISEMKIRTGKENFVVNSYDFNKKDDAEQFSMWLHLTYS